MYKVTHNLTEEEDIKEAMYKVKQARKQGTFNQYFTVGCSIGFLFLLCYCTFSLFILLLA